MMNTKAFALAFTLWLRDVKENRDEFAEVFEQLIPEPLEEIGDVMAKEFDIRLKQAITQLGEKYENTDFGAGATVDPDNS
jgi:hypothetical protein